MIIKINTKEIEEFTELSGLQLTKEEKEELYSYDEFLVNISQKFNLWSLLGKKHNEVYDTGVYGDLKNILAKFSCK